MKDSATELAIVQRVFGAIAEEMGVSLARTAFSPNIKERRDFSCALFDASGRLLAQAAHIPVHLGAMPRSVQAVLTDFPCLAAGDVVMLNDPFSGGSHLPDITLVSPLFLPGERTPAAYAATRAHHADVGGITPGSLPNSTSIFQEGLRIPPIRLVRGGHADPDVLRLFCANSRSPEERRGDLRAQLQAHHTAERRWEALVARYGPAEIPVLAEALLDYGARRMRSVLDSLPRGEWSHHEMLEGPAPCHPAAVLRATLRVDSEGVLIDFRASDDAIESSLNAVPAIVESAVYYVFLCLLHEYDPASPPPVNAGCFRDIRVLTRPGSVLDASWPHAVAGGNVETSQRLVDLVQGLLAQAIPGRIPAQSQGTMNNVTLGGRGFAYYETVGGGAGASARGPGASAIQCHMTNTLNTPVEALEFAYPMQVEELSIRAHSGGEGRHRGGDGMIRQWRLLTDAEVTLLTERRVLAPAGAEGGAPGRPGRQEVIRADGTREELPAKGSWRLRAGDALRLETPGGGGWGTRPSLS